MMNKPMISIEEFRKRQEAERAKRQYDSLGNGEAKEDFHEPDFGQNFEYATDPNVQAGQPRGSFGMDGVQYRMVNGKWTALKSDGSPMTPGEMYNHTSNMYKPGTGVSPAANMTGGTL